ncbi:hypothetical protein [Portibacter lacus]|uniref:Circularly permuted type 2 ATP-grasp protein n=1 Tax=Portibacter lacus TaxID=1099794 RepID=A0AA37SMI0_9BACT|nr:hypothetical protein [Portibacter lacus]GLR17131.1 hypothetical protein GCM10007940_17460 [Portibacter lacus]
MIRRYRELFNTQFSGEKYNEFLKDISESVNHTPPFRISETPIFVDRIFKEKLLQACSEILTQVSSSEFMEASKSALNHPSLNMPLYEKPCRFIQLDFGICEDEHGVLSPQLIELQGFPSLYFYQELLGSMYQKHFKLDPQLSIFPQNLTTKEYIDLLQKEIVGDTPAEQVVLLEIEPETQTTRIDFLCAEKMIGIKELCITELIKEGKGLFYLNAEGRKIKILKIFNRVIFDELNQRSDLKRSFRFSDEVDVEWIGHPTWFFRISKHSLPLLKSDYVPESYYLDQLEEYPEDLDQFVLKPLFSFAGSGVNLHLSKDLLDGISDRSNYIIQRKVSYKSIIETKDEPAKCEIRMMSVLNSETGKFDIVCNLARLTKGEMVGVKYNKNKEWVGGSVAFFEKDD